VNCWQVGLYFWPQNHHPLSHIAMDNNCVFVSFLSLHLKCIFNWTIKFLILNLKFSFPLKCKVDYEKLPCDCTSGVLAAKPSSIVTSADGQPPA
jgi:hypothetical protein